MKKTINIEETLLKYEERGYGWDYVDRVSKKMITLGIMEIIKDVLELAAENVEKAMKIHVATSEEGGKLIMNQLRKSTTDTIKSIK